MLNIGVEDGVDGGAAAAFRTVLVNFWSGCAGILRSFLIHVL